MMMMMIMGLYFRLGELEHINGNNNRENKWIQILKISTKVMKLLEREETISWLMKEDYINAASVFLVFLGSDIRFEFYSPIGCPSPRSNSAILASVVPQTDRIRSCDLFHYCCSVFSRVHNNATGSFPRSAYLSL